MSKYVEQNETIEYISALEAFMDETHEALMSAGAMESESGETNPGTKVREALAEARDAAREGDEREVADAISTAADAIDEIEDVEDESSKKKYLAIAAAAIAATAAAVGGVALAKKIKKDGGLSGAKLKTSLKDIGSKLKFWKKKGSKSTALVTESYGGIGILESLGGSADDPEEEIAALESYIADIVSEMRLDSALEAAGGDIEDEPGVKLCVALEEMRDAAEDGDVERIDESIEKAEDALDEVTEEENPDKKKRNLKIAAAAITAAALAVGATAAVAKIRGGEVSPQGLRRALKSVKDEARIKRTFRKADRAEKKAYRSDVKKYTKIGKQAAKDAKRAGK